MNRPLAFIAMPFGVKSAPDGSPIDFDAIHRELLAPALEQAGCTPLRADQVLGAGDIRVDMFQELLVADLVLVDVTLDNPNVWYELGVRHALQSRGVVLVMGPRSTSPFDIYTDRKRRYRLKDGRPDPACLEADRAAIAETVRETLGARADEVVSPVYRLLPHLTPPAWQELLLEQDNANSRRYRRWREQLEIARRKGQPGDLLVLAGETPSRALRLQARRDAGSALLKLEHAEYALEQFEAALAMAPGDREAAAKRVVCLGRLGRFEDAETAVEALIAQDPGQAEAHALAGRLAKERWQQRWRPPEPAPGGAADSARLREAAADADALLASAEQHYRRGFGMDANHHYSGINALCLAELRRHLGAEVDAASLERLRGGVAWAIEAALARGQDPWAADSAALLSLLRADEPVTVRRAFQAALAQRQNDWFAVSSARQMVGLLAELGLRSAHSTAALAVLDAELARLRAPVRPRKVLLFSGHRIDEPGRQPPRFPASKTAAAAARIDAELDRLELDSRDLALCQAACGGDLLFLQACQRRGVHLQLLLPFDEAKFIDESVRPCEDGEAWVQRYHEMRGQLRSAPRLMPVELGETPADINAYERCNLWLLYSALSWGPERLHFICLWNGAGGDGPGGTAHMLQEARRRTGRVCWIDSRTL